MHTFERSMKALNVETLIFQFENFQKNLAQNCVPQNAPQFKEFSTVKLLKKSL